MSVLAVASMVSSSNAASGTYGCWKRFAPAADRTQQGTARPDQAAERVLAEARRFPGDRHVGRLRWAAARTMTGGADLRPVRGGVVPISFPAGIVTDTDYGSEYPAYSIFGGLRVSDGKPLWTRRGSMTRLSTLRPAGSADLSTAQVFDPDGDIYRTAVFDMATGRGRWCEAWPESDPSVAGRGTVATEQGDLLALDRSITNIAERDGAHRWRTAPADLPYQHAVTGAGLVVAGTDSGFSVGGVATADPLSELAAFRLSDGKPVWKVADRAPKADLVQQWALTERRIIGIAAGRVLVEEAPGGIPRGPDRPEYRPRTAHVVAYDLGTGRRRWSRAFPLRKSSPPEARLVGERALVAEPTGSGGRVQALRVTDGSLEWSTQTPKPLELGRAVLYRQQLFMLDRKGGLTVLDVPRGAVHRSLTRLPSPPDDPPAYYKEGSITAGDGVLIVQARNLTLAFDLPAGRT